MFRRRRPGRRLLGRRAIRKGMQRVEEAERLFEDGRFGEAAAAFAQLAQGAARRGMIEPAGGLHRRAARQAIAHRPLASLVAGESRIRCQQVGQHGI
jgi:hypothetical protein